MAESYKKPDKILRVISEVNEAISVSNGNRNVLATILDVICDIFKVECCWVQRVTPADHRLHLAAYRGFTDVMRQELTASDMGRYFSDLVSRYGHKVIVPRLSPRSKIYLRSFHDARLHSLVAVPITTYRISGVLGLASSREKHFGKDTAALLTVIAGLLGTALEKAELYHRASSNGHPETDRLPEKEPPPPTPTSTPPRPHPEPAIRTAGKRYDVMQLIHPKNRALINLKRRIDRL